MGRLAAFEAAVAATAAEDADTIARLIEGIRQLSALTARQRMVLGAQLEQAIAEMAAADEALARQQARIERLKADQASLEEESTALTESFGHELDALAKWRQADADLADALDATDGGPATGPTFSRVRGVLTDLDTRLADIDSRLRLLLEARTKAREEALHVRNLSDHHAGFQMEHR
jgi:chromosome segregation ATPase